MNSRNALRVSTIGIAAVVIAGLSTAPAFADEASTSEELPRAATTLSPTELGEIGATQDAAEIAQIVALASPEQNVQVLLNFETKGYDAAVLIDESAEEGRESFLAEAKSSPAQAESTTGPSAMLAGIYTCSYTSGPKGISYHTSTAFYWCGSGSWQGGPLTGWKQYYNGISTNALVGPSNLTWAVCTGYTTCTAPAGYNLGYVSFN